MEEKISKRNWPSMKNLLSAALICLLLFAAIQCCRYAVQNRTLTAENEELSATLTDREQTFQQQAQETADLQIQLAEATSMEESGTSIGLKKKGGVYLIDDQEQLWTLQRMIVEGRNIEPGLPAATASYRLRNDIDFSFSYGHYDDPIPLFYLGTEEAPFCGSFDGDGHKIQGYFPLTADETPEALFHTDGREQIKNLEIDNMAAYSTDHRIITTLSEQGRCRELERHLPAFANCNIAVTISAWNLDLQALTPKLRKYWERSLAQAENDDFYISVTFYPESEETPAGEEAYIQELQSALLTLAGPDYSEMIEEALTHEEGYLWFLRLERIGKVICCTFEIGEPDFSPTTFYDNPGDSYYLITDGTAGKKVKPQCFHIPYTYGEMGSIGITSSYQIESVDLNFDGKEDLLIHEGSSGGSGGSWSNYRALVWKEDSGQFAYFPSFPEQVHRLEFDRQRIIFRGRNGVSHEYIIVYEIVNGEYTPARELVADQDGPNTVTLSYYEMDKLVETHILSDWDEKDALYPDLAPYWFTG